MNANSSDKEYENRLMSHNNVQIITYVTPSKNFDINCYCRVNVIKTY